MYSIYKSMLSHINPGHKVTILPFAYAAHNRSLYIYDTGNILIDLGERTILA